MPRRSNARQLTPAPRRVRKAERAAAHARAREEARRAMQKHLRMFGLDEHVRRMHQAGILLDLNKMLPPGCNIGWEPWQMAYWPAFRQGPSHPDYWSRVPEGVTPKPFSYGP